MREVKIEKGRDQYLEDVLERLRLATNDFTKDGEIIIPIGESKEMDFEMRTLQLSALTQMTIEWRERKDGGVLMAHKRVKNEL